jgi:sugar/nucleoside kinase (ribokinase family)
MPPQKQGMYDICCVGHITLDKVVTTKNMTYMPGGTSFYFSHAIRHMGLSYCLVTAIAEKEIAIITGLGDAGTEVILLPSTHTVYFENIYPGNQDHRIQKVSQKADPFTAEQLAGVEAGIFHLGPLLADDMPVALIKALSQRGKVSLDVQGYLREVRNEDVCAIDWDEKRTALQHIHILKANETEMETITGQKDVHTGAKVLHEWGVAEVVITLGSMGSVVYSDGTFYNIPAYNALNIVDATGCGDTYMAGYLSQRVKGASIEDAGRFAAAMATLKIEHSGPFTGGPEEVMALIADTGRKISMPGGLLTV